jgi:hypothetical protein
VKINATSGRKNRGSLAKDAKLFNSYFATFAQLLRLLRPVLLWRKMPQ